MSIRNEWPSDVTAQEVFEHVMRHLIEQRGYRAVDGNDSCVYRTEDGRACAVGACLTNAEAAAVPQNSVVGRLHELGMLPVRLRPHVDLLSDLQYVHDTDASSGRVQSLEQRAYTMTRKLRDIATKRGVNVTVAQLDALHASFTP